MHMGALIDHLMQFHNAWVPQIRECVDLPMHCHLGLFVLQIFLVIGLDRNHMLCLFVNSPSHDCKGPLANLEADLEFFEF